MIREITYLEALREALREEMLRDERVILLGEDTGIYGGAFAVTKGLLHEFGADRVIDTPISEAGIAALGGTFAITNLGMFWVDAFTSIIAPKQTAILGIGRISEKPQVVNGRVKAEPMVILSLSFDHRVVDGASATQFLQRIKQILEKTHFLSS